MPASPRSKPPEPKSTSRRSRALRPRLQPLVDLVPRRPSPLQRDRSGAMDPLAQPRRSAPRGRAPHLGSARPERELHGGLSQRRGRVRSVPGRTRHVVVPQALSRVLGRAGRLPVDRVRLARVPRDLLRRAGDPFGRSLQVRQRPGDPVRRRRPDVPARLLPAVDRRRRPPAALLSRLRSSPLAGVAGGRTREQAAAGRRSVARPLGGAARLDGAGRACAGPAARLRRARERPGGLPGPHSILYARA